MQWFFNRISTKFYPVNFGYSCQDKYKKEFDILVGQGILKRSSNLNEIECGLCDTNHTTQVRQDSNRLFIVCENGCGARDVLSDELAIYEYQATQFLSLYQSALGINYPKVTENILGLLWSFGSQKINSIEYQLFFTNDIDEIDSGNLSIITAFPNAMLFYTGIPHRPLPQNVCLIPILDTIKSITKKGILVDKEKIQPHTLAVLFKNGDIFIRGKKLGHIPTGTADYFFVEKLWQHFNTPVSHEDLFRYCKTKLNKDSYEETPQKFCNKRMSEIRKKLADKEKVDNIFTSEKTKNGLNGYKMRLPE